MPLPPFITRLRKDPFGVIGYNQLLSALRWQSGVFGYEHDLVYGAHNTPEVPAACGSLVWSGTNYSIVNQSGGLLSTSLNGPQSLYNPVPGEVHISLDGPLGTGYPGDVSQLGVELNPACVIGATNPVVAGYQVEPAQNMVRIFLQGSTFGAGGNVWTAVDGDIDFAIYTAPQATGADLALGTPSIRGQGLRAPSRWNRLVQGLATFNALFLTGHNGFTGAHTAGVVAKAQGVWKYDTATQLYTQASGSGITSVTKVSEGIALVGLDPNLKLPLQVFPEPIASATTNCFVMYAPTATRAPTGFYVFSWSMVDHTSYVGPPPYTYDARWELKSCSLAVAVHGT